jgi:CheY-like chemotaxis protein
MLMKALIVDDSLESRMLLGKILSKAFDTKIIEATQGKDALKIISEEKPDVVFLDYEMPVMNGIETLKAIRSHYTSQELPVVMVTSHSEADILHELLSYKVSAYLVKPLSTDYVVKRLSVIFPPYGIKH